MTTTYHYYISSGSKNRMYTLRVSYQEICHVANGDSYPVIRDYYCCNLSTDFDKAYAKAKERFNHDKDWLKNQNLDIEYVLVDQKDVPTLDDIYRRNQEEMEIARKLAEETAKKAEQEREEREQAYCANLTENIVCGLWPFGAFSGQPFEAADDSYIHYFIDLKLDKDEDGFYGKRHAVMVSLKNKLKSLFPHLVNLPKANDKFYGEIKKRENFNLTLVAEFSFESYAFSYCGQIIFVQKFVKDTGELIVYKGSAPIDCRLGKSVKVKATIKGHEDYKGENQTLINRPKKLEDK